MYSHGINPVSGVIVIDCDPGVKVIVALAPNLVDALYGLPNSSNKMLTAVAVNGAMLCVAEDSLGSM
jgi:hypothetical protein